LPDQAPRLRLRTGHATKGRFWQEIAVRKLRHCIRCHRPDLIRLADRPSALLTAQARSPASWRADFRRRKDCSPPTWGRFGTTHSGGVLLAPLPEQRKSGLDTGA